MSDLVIKNLHVSIEDKEILKGLDLTIHQGKVHAVMGPNGTGKSTLAYTLMGHPNYTVTQGEIIFKDQNILELQPDERSRMGIFLAFQYPVAIPGVTVANFLRTAMNARRRAANPEDKGVPIPEFRKLVKSKMDMLKMDQNFAGRYLNDGFSGGEKKRAEILQMAVLKPEIAIMDETDSGLGYRCLADRLRRRQYSARQRPGHIADYPLSTNSKLHQPGLCAYYAGWPGRGIGRRQTSLFTSKSRATIGFAKSTNR